MNKRFFLIFIVCFLLMPIRVAHADLIAPGPIEMGIYLIVLALLIVALVVGTFVMIRMFWKPKVMQPTDTDIHKSSPEQ